MKCERGYEDDRCCINVSGGLILQIAPDQMFDFSGGGTRQQIVCERDDREKNNDEDGERCNLHADIRIRRTGRSGGAATEPQPG